MSTVFVNCRTFEEVPVGSKVYFEVENQDIWIGDNSGIMRHDGNEFYIKCKRSGRVTIGKGYDAYPGTITKCLKTITKMDSIIEDKIKGVKHDSDKLRWDLLPMKCIEGIVEVLTYGAAKYEPDNWKHVRPFQSRYYAALMRHLVAWLKGERDDPESGLHHWKTCINVYDILTLV